VQLHWLGFLDRIADVLCRRTVFSIHNRPLSKGISPDKASDWLVLVRLLCRHLAHRGWCKHRRAQMLIPPVRLVQGRMSAHHLWRVLGYQASLLQLSLNHLFVLFVRQAGMVPVVRLELGHFLGQVRWWWAQVHIWRHWVVVFAAWLFAIREKLLIR
jgi:hypothetical protein